MASAVTSLPMPSPGMTAILGMLAIAHGVHLGTWGSPLQVQPVTEPGQCAASSLVVGLSFPNDRLEPIGQKRTDGTTFFGGNDAYFPKKVSVDFEPDVCLHRLRD
jgi:hypothetical protein